MKKLLFSVLSLLMLCIGMKAQTNIANYKFASSAGTYVPLTGATTLLTAWDDQVSASIPLGGNFTFGAVTYTACFINGNGYITFGGSATGYTPLSTNSASAAISAFGRDGASSTVVGATPLISYMNIGGATGEFVVEYKDHATYGGRSSERLNMQIRLDLVTGSVKFVYGSWSAPAAGTTAQVGIRGNSTNWADNVNSLNTLDVPVGTTCTWANPVNSDSNGSTMLFSTGNALITPSNGLTYTWAPPVNATLAPVRLFTAVTGIATTSATINWTAPTGATQYNVQYRIPGTCSWTNFSGNPVAATTATLTGLTPATIYQVRVQSNDGSNNANWSHIPNSVGTGNGYSATGTFSTIATCPATSNSTVTAIGSNSAVATWTVNGTETAWDIFYGPTPLTAPTATSIPTATSSVNSFTFAGLNPVTGYAVYVRANCGAGDMSTWAGPRNFTTLALPTDLQTLALNAPAVNAIGCYGSSIPVVIQIKNTGTTVLDFSTNNATVLTSITGTNPQSFTTTVNTGTLAANATLNVTVTSTYNMSAAGVYTINASSTLATPDANTTNDAMAIATRTVTTGTPLPYAQDFATGATPVGWVNTSSWSFATSHGLTNNGIYKNIYSSGTSNSSFNLLKLGTVSGSESVTFDFRVLNYSSYPIGGVPTGNWGNVQVQVSTDCGATFATIGTIDNTTHTVTTQAWSNKGFSLAAYAGQSVIIKVLGTWVTGDYYVDMDNFNIASCFPPSAIAASNITTTGANIAWVAPFTGTPASYIWEVRTSGAAGSGATGLATSGTVTAPSTSVNVTGLATLTNYTVYVQSNCGGTDVSNWASSTFTTLANCPVPTAYNSTGITATTATFTWTAGGSETAWDIFIGSTPNGTTVPTATTSSASYTATGLSSPNTYSVYVRSNCGGSTSTWVLSTVIINYCTPAPISVDGSGITNVTIAPGINNTTVAEVGNYGNYSAQVANAQRALPLTVNITFATGYTYDTKIWIDFNDDLDFNDAGEEVYSGASLSTNPTTLTATFNIPLTAPLGTHRLRIGSQDAGPAIPCYTGSYGSYEDYSINVLPAPTCIPTSSITLSAITPTSAVSTWTAVGTETAWDVYYGATPLTAPTATTVPTATASATSYTLNSLTPSTGYAVYVRANCGSGDLSLWTSVSSFTTPCLPPNILTTAGSIRCGIGTTTLAVTADPGATLQWYANATGGAAIATGSVYTTPTISTTTNYYVSAANNFITANVGMASTTGANGSNGAGAYLIFDALSAFTLNSVDIYPQGSGAGSVVIELQNSAGTSLQTVTVSATGNATAIAQTVNVNFNITPGTGYRLNYLASSGGITAMYRETGGAAFPYTAPGIVSITDGSLAGYYYYFYNWSVSSGCESARTMVTATVTSPAILSVTSGTTICANAIKTLSVTSTVADYDNYNWTPNTNLYTDAAATTSYTGGNASTLYYSSSAISNTTYTINASNSVNGCANQTSTFMMSDMPVIYASVNPSVVCLSNSVTLTANTNGLGSGIVNVGAGSITTSGSGSSTGNNVSPFSHYFGGYKAQYIIRASDLTAAGLFAGNITSLSYSVTTAGVTYTDFAIGIAATTQSVANTTFNNALAPAYGPSSATPTVGLNTYNFSTPFNWNGTSNIVVAICWSNNNGGGVAAEVAYDPTSYTSTSYVRSDNQTSGSMCGNTTVTGTTNNRPLLVFGGQTNIPSVGTVNWTWNPGAIPTNTAIVTPTVAGTQSYTVTAVDPATTCSNTAMVTVTVNAAPTVTVSSSSASVCAGSSATLTAMGTATSFTWTSGGNAMTAIVTPTTATVYTVTAGTMGCSTITETVSVGVNAVPSVTATATSTLLCSNLGESAIISWTDGVNTLTTSVTPTVATTYTFAINDGTCLGSTTIFIDVQTCTGINSLVNSGAINIFPNPTNGILNIAITAELAGSTSIEVYDAIGKLVIKEALSNETTTINTSKLTDGMYFYKVINNNKAINIGKIVKH